MVKDYTPGQYRFVADSGGARRNTLGGDEFLDAVVEAISGNDMDKRAWARAMMDHEDTVASFVANVRRTLGAVREARGLSIDAAAERVGVSSSALTRLETGSAAQADLKLVARVALLLGVMPRFDFTEHGTATIVSVDGLQTGSSGARGLRDLGRSSLTGQPGSRAASAHPASGVAGDDAPADPAMQVPTVLDQRIRDLEDRIAAMEHPRSEDSG